MRKQGQAAQYAYDLMQRLVKMTEPLHHNPSAYQYDAAGRLAARKVQAGTSAELVTQRYGYDQVERLSQIKYIKAEGTASEQAIEKIDYGYDAKGQRTSKTALNNNGMGAGETPMTKKPRKSPGSGLAFTLSSAATRAGSAISPSLTSKQPSSMLFAGNFHEIPLKRSKSLRMALYIS